MKKPYNTLTIGPDLLSQGGIASVIKMHSDYSQKLKSITLSSYKDGSYLKKLIVYFIFIYQYLFKLIANKNIKIIHIHTASRASFFRKAIVLKIATLFRKKTILHIHGAEFPLFYQNSKPFIRNIIRNILNQSNLVIVLSKQWKDTILNICPNANVQVLYNPTITRKIYKKNNKTTKIVFMGRLGKRKGVYDIFEAAKLLKSDIQIELYGDGHLEKFKQLIVEKNLKSKVKIMGWIGEQDKDNILKSSDIYILPSYNEGLPISILEALAYGLPVISTPVGGICEAVKNNENGFIIQPGDYKMLAEKIELLSTNKELREKMGSKSFELAKEIFDINIIVNKLAEIYDELIK